MKEMSLMKKEGYKKYSAKSYLILFKIFKSDLVNLMVYTGLIVGGVYCYFNLDLVNSKLALLHKKAFPSN